MKRLFHTPGLMLVAFCGLVCCLCAWERAEDFFAQQYDQLARRCL